MLLSKSSSLGYQAPVKLLWGPSPCFLFMAKRQMHQGLGRGGGGGRETPWEPSGRGAKDKDASHVSLPWLQLL